MTTIRSFRWTAALAVLVMVAVGACQEPQDPPSSTGAESSEASTEPSPEPTTTTPPVDPTPEVEPPVRPPEMQVDNIDGAAATVAYFLRSYNYMLQTGDSSLFEELSADSCNWCADSLAMVTSQYEQSGSIVGQGFDFDIATSLVEFPTSENPAYTVRLDATLLDYVLVAPDGTRTEKPATSFSPFAVGVLYSNGSFTVTGVNYAVA